MSRNGISNDTIIVLYGDKNNWWACYAFWVFKLFGHKNAKVMDGGRIKWENESRKLNKEVPSYPGADYSAPQRDDHLIRAFREDVLSHVSGGLPLVDVRSPEEFSGERLHMPDYPNEGALRGGHIPGHPGSAHHRPGHGFGGGDRPLPEGRDHGGRGDVAPKRGHAAGRAALAAAVQHPAG